MQATISNHMGDISNHMGDMGFKVLVSEHGESLALELQFEQRTWGLFNSQDSWVPVSDEPIMQDIRAPKKGVRWLTNVNNPRDFNDNNIM